MGAGRVVYVVQETVHCIKNTNLSEFLDSSGSDEVGQLERNFLYPSLSLQHIYTHTCQARYAQMACMCLQYGVLV